MIRNNPNYYVQQEYQLLPEVQNPISTSDMNTLEYEMNVLEPGAVSAFEMDVLESGQMAARAAAEAGEGFWATIWSGLKRFGAFFEEMASGMAVIYPQYAPPNPWKELQVKKANESSDRSSWRRPCGGTT